MGPIVLLEWEKRPIVTRKCKKNSKFLYLGQKEQFFTPFKVNNTFISANTP